MIYICKISMKITLFKLLLHPLGANELNKHWFHQWFSAAKQATNPSIKSMMTQVIDTYTVQCRYNAVNFLLNPHNRHLIARPWGRGMGGVSCEFSVWFLLHCCHCSAYVISWYIRPRYSSTRLYISGLGIQQSFNFNPFCTWTWNISG